MSDRPWLEALKRTMSERSADTNEPPEENPQTLPLGGCERCESPTGELPPVTDIPSTPTIRGEDEERLLAAGWTPKERGGLLIWASPETGFYCSQEVALHRLKLRGDAP